MLSNRSRTLRQVWEESALAGVQVGVGTHLDGRPWVENHGQLQIGSNFKLSSRPVRSHLVVGVGGRLEIGDDVSIAFGASISANLSVSIGNAVQLGPFVMVLDSDFHAAGDHGAGGRSDPISIGPGARIGSRVTVLRGSRIGAGALVMAGSVVADVVAPGTRIAGIPARPTENSPEVLESSASSNLASEVQAMVGSALNLAGTPALDQGPRQLAHWDSLATLKIILVLEEHFHFTIDEHEMQRVEDVGDLVTVVEKALSRQR